MTYAAYDVNDYLGDVASIGGWADFARWARDFHGGEEAAQLVEAGVSRNPRALATQLTAGYATDPEVESVRSNLAELAARAEGLLIVSDG